MDHTGANSLFTTKHVNDYLSVLNTNTRKAVNKGILFIYAYKDLYTFQSKLQWDGMATNHDKRWKLYKKNQQKQQQKPIWWMSVTF